MNKRHKFFSLLLAFACISLALAPTTGCGDSRPKIRRPENPTRPPDPSMRLNFGGDQAAPADDDKDKQ